MFDLDGTLLRTDAEDALYVLAMKEWLSVDSIDEEWTNYEHVTDVGVAAELYERIRGCKPSNNDLKIVSEIFLKKWKNQLDADPNACAPMAGVTLFLNNLQTLDNPSIAIATGAWEKTAKLKLDHCHMQSPDVVIATCDDAYSRENIMEIAYERSCQKGKISGFEKTVYFGDGEWDVEAASHLGFDFIGINSSNKREALMKSGAKFIFDDFRDYTQLIDLIYNN
jgi:phosphoglycolate phosphatase-like HAD superfamily hydrolase